MMLVRLIIILIFPFIMAWAFAHRFWIEVKEIPLHIKSDLILEWKGFVRAWESRSFAGSAD